MEKVYGKRNGRLGFGDLESLGLQGRKEEGRCEPKESCPLSLKPAGPTVSPGVFISLCGALSACAQLRFENFLCH